MQNQKQTKQQFSLKKSTNCTNTPIHSPGLEWSDSCRLPTDYGDFRLQALKDKTASLHYLLSKNLSSDTKQNQRPLIRIHSSCCTGDLFASTRCDCGYQLQEAMRQISDHGTGAVIYLAQEGRGIGIFEKIKAYNLQDQGYNTYQANHKLGFADDLRTYDLAISILKTLKIFDFILLSQNPEKLNALRNADFLVSSQALFKKELTPDQKTYLSAKAQFKNHALDV